MSHNSDMIKLVKLMEGKQQFAGEEVGQKPGDQVRGTDKAKTGGKDHPFKGRLVGEDTTLEDRLAKKYQDFKELQAKEKAEKKEKEVDEEKQRLDPKCWDGYKKQGTKMKGDTRVNNCVPESVRIGSNLPQSDIETFGLEKGRGYKINTPKDWKPGDRPRAMQQLIPTQDKKDHIRSRLGKHKSPVLPEQDVAEGLDPVKKGRLYDLIELYRDATEPNAYYDRDIDDPDEVIAMIRSEFGDKIANQVEAGAEKMHYPRHGIQRSDPLGGNRPVDRITKAGKMYKQDMDFRKRMSKYRMGIDEQGVVEGWKEKVVAETQLDEISQDTARSYVQKAIQSKKDLTNQTYRKGADLDKLNKKIVNRQQGMNRAHTDKRYYKDEQGVEEGFGEEHSPVTQAITRRILLQRTDLLSKYGPEKVAAAIDDVADFVGDVDEIGSSDVSGWVRQVEQSLSGMGEGMTADQKLSELGATPPPAPAGTATAAPTTGNVTPTAGSVSPDEQTALNKIQTNPAMKQQLDKLMTQATPGAATKPMELNPEQEDALEKIKANAGLKTQYDKIIKQANPQAKV